MTMTLSMAMTTMTVGRGRGRSRSQNLSGAGAGAVNFKNGRLRQPWFLGHLADLATSANSRLVLSISVFQNF